MLLRSAAIVGLLVIWSLVPSTTRADDENPVVIDGLGTWALSDLGYEDTVVVPSDAGEPARFLYALPPDASQGPDDWYKLNLHVVVDFTPDSPAGRAWIAGTTNGRESVLLSMELREEAGHKVITSNAATLEDGNLVSEVIGTSIDTSSLNYLQLAGVKGGENVLEVSLVQGKARVSSFRVLADTSIVVLDEDPQQLHIQAPTIVSAGPGQVQDVSVSVTRSGDWESDSVEVEFHATTPGLQIQAPNKVQVSLEENGDSAEANFRVSSSTVGTYTGFISATAGNLGTAANVTIAVSESRTTWERILEDYLPVGALLLGVPIFVWGTYRVTRRSP